MPHIYYTNDTVLHLTQNYLLQFCNQSQHYFVLTNNHTATNIDSPFQLLVRPHCVPKLDLQKSFET